MLAKLRFAYAIWRILVVIQWGLILSTIPCLFIAGLMRYTGWDSEWAPAFLGTDGGGIVGCIALLMCAFFVWIAEGYFCQYYALPRIAEFLGIHSYGSHILIRGYYTPEEKSYIVRRWKHHTESHKQ